MTENSKAKSSVNIDTNITYLPDEADLLDPVLTKIKPGEFLDRLLGCIYGQALGDAYGLCNEFLTREQIQESYPDPQNIIPFPNADTTPHARRWIRGDWTDDTDQWILIMETLMEPNGDEKLFAKKLMLWVRQGFPELNDFGGLGLGINVAKVICSDGYLENPIEASRNVWEQSGKTVAPNGAVMRCSIIGAVHYADIEKVKSVAKLLCQVTHFDPRCVASCVSVCLAIAHLLKTPDITDIESLIADVQQQTFDTIGDELSAEYRNEFSWHTSKDRTLDELKLDEEQKIGYTYKCLASGFYGLRSNSPFAVTLNALVQCGGDSDTNGAVCGTMFGARYGYRSLPQDWLRAMPYKKWLDAKVLRLLNHMNLLN